MNSYRALTIAGILLSLGGCSSIVQGTDQEIAVNTNPSGATCNLEREGNQIGAVLNTPGVATVSKTKHDITITCEKEGYQTATYLNDSGWESGSGAAGIALDVVLTLGISSAIDSATGADNKYESPVNITMVPLNEPSQSTAASAYPADASWDGEWLAQAGPWQLYMKIENGNFTGRAMRTNADPYEVSGRILQDGLVAGRVDSNGVSAGGSLSGSFPSVSIVQNGQVQASFELAKKV